jgi:cytochrome c oxidase cbb3-type subunit 3
MSSPCPRLEVVALGLALFALAGCDREQRESRGTPLPETAPVEIAGDLGKDPRRAHYENSAFHVSEGERWFRWFNCSGCHGNGGGGMGPALMDHAWRYEADIDGIYRSVEQGRPNGMPAFRGKMTEQQIWQVASYVRALSGNVGKDVPPSRRESLSGPPVLTRHPRQTPSAREVPSPPRPPATYPGPAQSAPMPPAPSALSAPADVEP